MLREEIQNIEEKMGSVPNSPYYRTRGIRPKIPWEDLWIDNDRFTGTSCDTLKGLC